MTVEPKRDGLAIQFTYDRGLFAKKTIERLSEQFRYVFQTLCESPEMPLCRLSTLPPTERELLRDYSGRRAGSEDKPSNGTKTIHQRIETIARECPNAVAVSDSTHSLTFEELNRRANRIARFLQSQGVKPGSHVGVLCDRTCTIVPAILGVLKAGAGYTALDRNYPPARLALMQREAKIAHLLCDSESDVPQELVQSELSRILSLERYHETICAESPLDLDVGVTSDDVAYVVFTSGSSGTPKGVVLNHRGLVDYVDAMKNALGVRREDAYLHTASFSFSSSVRQMFLPLACGARLVLASHRQIQDVAALIEFIVEQNVTCLDIVPSYFRALLSELRQGEANRHALEASALRLVALASEPLQNTSVRQWADLFGTRFGIVNMYGQTETTGIVATFPVPLSEDPSFDATGLVPIGRPIDSASIYILDADRQPVPVGAFGELYVATTGLARGYLNNDALTEARFVSNPFGAAGERMYRTGDIACFGFDGTIRFQRRADFQVKIRGFRVEPGEVEAALCAHEHVREAAVIARRDPEEEAHLVAYVVPLTSSTPLDRAVLREQVMRHLPEYMVPSQFLVVEALPKTPNGKVDRQALSVLAGGAPAVPRTSPASAGDRLEAQIADIWRRVLRISDVANDDNFFALGGHSLSAVVVATYLSQALGTRVPPAVIIQHQTIKAIARQLGSTLGRPAQPMEPMNDIVELQSGVSLFLVHAMGPSASWYRPLARYLGPGTRVFAIEAPGSMDALSSVEAIAATHIQSVRRLQGKGPYRLAGGSLGGVIAYEMARQLESAGEVVSFVGLFDSPFPESAPPQDEAAIMARTFGGIVKASALRGKSSEAQFQLIRDAVQAARSDSPGLPRVLSMLVEDYETWLIQWRRMIALREAVYRYRPGPYEGRTVYFEADRLGFADEDGQKKYLGRWMQRAEKWAGVARQAVIRPFVGTHVDMLSEEFVAEAGGLGEAMRAELSLLERDPSDGDIERQAGGRR